MMHAKKLVSAAATMETLLLALPFLVVLTDAAAVLESTDPEGVEVEDAFCIEAWRMAGDHAEGELVRALTDMHLEYETEDKGARGVLFKVASYRGQIEKIP
jgi:hypothetical protein